MLYLVRSLVPVAEWHDKPYQDVKIPKLCRKIGVVSKGILWAVNTLISLCVNVGWSGSFILLLDHWDTYTLHLTDRS